MPVETIGDHRSGLTGILFCVVYVAAALGALSTSAGPPAAAVVAVLVSRRLPGRSNGRSLAWLFQGGVAVAVVTKAHRFEFTPRLALEQHVVCGSNTAAPPQSVGENHKESQSSHVSQHCLRAVFGGGRWQADQLAGRQTAPASARNSLVGWLHRSFAGSEESWIAHSERGSPRNETQIK